MALLSSNKKQNEFVRLSVTLFSITFIVAFLLAVVNHFTSGKIAQINQQRLEQAMMEVLPEATAFTDVTEVVTASWTGETPVLSAKSATNKKGELIGYCIQVSPKGYSDEIDMMVGLNAEGEITDTSIITIADTPGIGTQVQEPEFLSQFIGKKGVLTAVKGTATAKNEVALISGATYSSSGFTNGVNAALRAYEIIVGEVSE